MLPRGLSFGLTGALPGTNSSTGGRLLISTGGVGSWFSGSLSPAKTAPSSLLRGDLQTPRIFTSQPLDHKYKIKPKRPCPRHFCPRHILVSWSAGKPTNLSGWKPEKEIYIGRHPHCSDSHRVHLEDMVGVVQGTAEHSKGNAFL